MDGVFVRVSRSDVQRGKSDDVASDELAAKPETRVKQGLFTSTRALAVVHRLAYTETYGSPRSATAAQ